MAPTFFSDVWLDETQALDCSEQRFSADSQTDCVQSRVGVQTEIDASRAIGLEIF
jgi:hypothetical protein